MKRKTEIYHDIPLFEANAEDEIDEVFESVIWDLCGRSPRNDRARSDLNVH